MAKGEAKLIRIIGQVVDRKTKAGLAGLSVEAWDKALILSQPFAAAVTDQQGSFIIEFKKGRLKDSFGERDVLLFFKVFHNNDLIAGTQDSAIWSRESPDQEIIIQVETVEPPPVDKPKKQRPLRITGQLRRADGTPISEGIVRAFIITPEKEVPLGESQTDPTGNFEFNSSADRALVQQPDARLQVRAFDRKATMLATSSSLIQESPMTINLTVAPPPDEACVVYGQVRNANLKPLDRGTVRIFGVVPAPETLLGQQPLTSADDGRYRIEYQAGRFSPRMDDTTRVVVRVFDAEDRLLQPTSPLFRANPEELVDITLSTGIEKPTFIVRGQITRRGGGTLSNGIVRAFDTDVVAGTLLGETRSDDKGNYQISYTPAPSHSTVSRNPDLIIGAFDDQLKLLGNSDVRRDSGPDEIIDFEIPAAGPGTIDPAAPVNYTVEGRVSSPDSAGVGNLRVRIVDKNVGGDVTMAETQTDAQGDYSVTFPVPSLTDFCKEKPDLQARVFFAQTFLAASEVRYYANPREILNVTLPSKSAALPSEHETLVDTLARHCAGILESLQETDDRQDITYLANKTGWDARAVALAALADKFGRSTGAVGGTAEVPPALFYALFRAGLPANQDIFRTDAQTLTAIWNQAAEQGVIPKSMTSRIPQALAYFKQTGAQKLLAAPAVIGASSMKQMLIASRLNEDQQTRFALLYQENRTDTSKLWTEVTGAFGSETANRLQLNGQLGFLTINNARLTEAIHFEAGANGISNPLQLAQRGYHSANKWLGLINSDMPIPKEIPGSTPEAKRTNYAEFLAAQVRLSYPTASVAQMVESRVLPLPGAPESAAAQVNGFLTAHQGRFEIGAQPVQQYIARNAITVDQETVTQVARLQRVFQITPTDQAMTGLMKNGLDSAFKVTGYDRDGFVQTFALELGGPEIAAQTYDKSVQVHNTTLNIAISYLTAKNGLQLGAPPLTTPPSGDGAGLVIQPAPTGASGSIAADVIAYPTLEGLFGEMDFCACDHCRSILSPAAYLVDLLSFVGPDAAVWASFRATWRTEHGGAPYPFADLATWNAGGQPADTEITALDVLLSRRPDIQHLPLTCENTNTALPYIDLVNETLEYFIANSVRKLSLEGYVGHDTDRSESADLLASPQFVMDSAYAALASEHFPPPLPFHQPLESLRRYFEKFEVPLPLAMETLRKSDDLERGANRYGWRDIRLEAFRISTEEYKTLTDSAAVPLWKLFGFPSLTSSTDIINGNPAANIPVLSNAKQFARRVGITYEEIAAILETRFVNPNSDLIPKLERLGVSFSKLKDLKDGAISEADFLRLLPAGSGAPAPAAYGGNIAAWVKDDGNFNRIMKLITLVDPTNDSDPCNFEHLEFRFSKPMTGPTDISTRLTEAEFYRLLRFVRLWEKTGWTIAQTDAAICALFRNDLTPLSAGDVDDPGKLDAGFKILLPRLGVVVAVMKALNLTTKRDLLPLLACWSDIGKHGEGSLYKQMFLNPAILNQDSIFADNGFGDFLQKADAPYTHSQPNLQQPIRDAGPGISYDNVNKQLSYTGVLNAATRDALKHVAGVSTQFQAAVDALYAAKRLMTHSESLRSAFNITGDEFDRIVKALGYDSETLLTLPNIGAIFRRGYLARKLKISVREFLLLSALTQLDPFAAPDVTNPAMLRLISLIQAMKERSLNSAVALYLIWNQDLSGKSAPASADVTEFARTLRGDFAGIEDQLAAADDADGDIARARMTLVYGQETSDAFFALLDDTLIVDVAYTHGASSLEAAITAADSRISYDNFKHRLSHSGLLTQAMQTALKAVGGITPNFKDAVDALFVSSEDSKGSFFARYAELRPLYDGTIALDSTLLSSVSYTHPTAALEPAITAVSSRITYDNTNLRLSYSGLLANAQRDGLKAVPGVTSAFQAAVDALFAASQKAKSAVLAELKPELSRRRKRQQALQRLSAAAGIDLPSTQVLLDQASNAFPLHAFGHTDQPALNDVLALETPGLEARFFFRDTATGIVDRTVPAAANLDYAADGSNPLPPNAGAAVSGIWIGQVEPPENGFYNFIIEGDPGATVTLTLGGQSRPLTQNGNLHRNTDALELRAGTLLDFELKVQKVKTKLSVKWETPKRPREVIAPRYLYPRSILGPFTDVYIRFLKTASLALGLRLTAAEIAHFATDADYRISGDGWLNTLPVTGNASDPIAAALLKPLKDLVDYARIKSAISPDDETLLAVLEDPTSATADAEGSLFTITGWDSASFDSVLNHFGINKQALTHFDQFRRVYDTFAVIEKIGIPAGALIAATTNEPTGNTVRDFQSALRARYDSAAWRDVVQPINDTLRGLQRDALVSYVLHQMRSNVATRHIDTADKLFEYFLMDVQMEPCMQTSRIRNALSSVQLFIERCLMNLEPRVSPAAIDAKQWEWMKRYRVWEANRKVFLYPENWAEPELRDDQSPFFKETMSELLQGDITEDRAAVALLTYLGKLEEVAKLEPCGIHYVENDPGADDDMAHVVARTSGAHRKYFYRRREFGFWTAWEHIKLDIEDNPVLPVVWNNRLFLFWLRIMKQAPIDPNSVSTSASSSEHAANLSLGQIKTDAKSSAQSNVKVKVQAMLCWSEFFNGKWQPARTSDINQPLELGDFLPNAFDRSKLLLSAFFFTRGTLRIIVSTDVGAGASFFLYNTHSSPELRNEKKKNRHFAPKRVLETSTSSLKITYPLTSVSHPVLVNEINDRTIDPHHPVSGNPWDVPFFYEDSRHVFYVTTAQRLVPFSTWRDLGFVSTIAVAVTDIPALVVQAPKTIPDFAGPVVKQPGFGVVDPLPIGVVISEDAYIRRGIGTLGTVRYGDKDIGPAGSTVKTIQKR